MAINIVATFVDFGGRKLVSKLEQSSPYEDAHTCPYGMSATCFGVELSGVSVRLMVGQWPFAWVLAAVNGKQTTHSQSERPATIIPIIIDTSTVTIAATVINDHYKDDGSAVSGDVLSMTTIRPCVGTLLLVENPGFLEIPGFFLCGCGEMKQGRFFALLHFLWFFWKPPVFSGFRITKNGNIWRRGQHGLTFCGDQCLCFLEGPAHVAS